MDREPGQLQSVDLQSIGCGLATQQQQGLCCCSGFSPVGVSWGSSAVEVLGLVIALAEHGLEGEGASVVVACGLGSCGAQAWLLCGMWNLLRLGIETVSPAFTSGFFTSKPPGMPQQPHI